MSSSKTEKETYWQNRLVLEAMNVKKNALNDVASLYDGVAVASTREAQLLSRTSAGTGPMARATAELRQA